MLTNFGETNALFATAVLNLAMDWCEEEGYGPPGMAKTVS